MWSGNRDGQGSRGDGGNEQFGLRRVGVGEFGVVGRFGQIDGVVGVRLRRVDG